MDSVGVRGLLAELIRHAASDWIRYRDSPHKIRRRYAEEAYLWLFEEDDFPYLLEVRKAEGRSLTSFAAICEALDLDLDKARSCIMQISPQALNHHARKLSAPSAASSDAAHNTADADVHVHTALGPLFGSPPGGFDFDRLVPATATATF